MKTRKWIVMILVALVFGVFVFDADARWGKQKSKHADKNKDGKISRKEFKKEKKFEHKKKARANASKEADTAKTNKYIENRSDVNREWEANADADKNGKVSAGELRSYRKTVMDKNEDGNVGAKERKTFWLRKRSRVNTQLEKKHDADNNGYIGGEEAKKMLRNRLRIINTHGKAKVDSAIESEYDANGDGVINVDEAHAIRDALGE